MANKSLKKRTVAAIAWSGAGHLGTVLITFISNMILSRLLMPEDFGCIGMLLIFITISDALAIGGLGQALIQKKNPSHIDYSTVFYCNVFASFFFYFIIFLIAPIVAQFYNMPILCDVMRVQALTIIFHAIYVVQSTQLQRDLRFKEFSLRNIIAAICGTIVAIIVALNGGGVWSLVFSTVTASFVSIVLLWNMSKWRPTLEFSWKSFKELFFFGGMIMLSNIFERIYSNIQGLVIGKFYSAKDMGYYSQAFKLEQIPINTISQTVAQVSFPVFSSLQDSLENVRNAVKKNIVCLTYLNFPVSLLMMVLASPLIRLFYGSKWDEAIPYFQILCLAGLFTTTNAMNINVIKGLGKGKIFFFVQVAKRVVGISFILIGAFIGMYGILWAAVSVAVFEFILNGVLNKRLINYGVIAQLKDTSINMVMTFLSLIPVLLFTILDWNQFILMPIQILSFAISYLLLSATLKSEAFEIYKMIVVKAFKNLSK